MSKEKVKSEKSRVWSVAAKAAIMKSSRAGKQLLVIARREATRQSLKG